MSFILFFAPSLSYANIVTSTGKYIINAVKHVPAGAKVEATSVATGAKHVIKHGVTAPALGSGIGASIAGGLIGGGVGIAFQSITGFALDAVDWVLDPENSAIKYKVGSDNSTSTSQYRYYNGEAGQYAYSDSQAKSIAQNFLGSGRVVVGCSGYGNYVLECFWHYGDPSDLRSFDFYRSLNPDYDPSSSDADGYKKVLLIDLAKKLLEQADSGNVDSQKTIEDYVTNLAKDGKLDSELDNSTDITKPDKPDNPEDKDKDCPLGSKKENDICIKVEIGSDSPQFCNANEFTRKICDWIDWTQKKPTESNQKPVEVKDVKADNSDKINMSGSCPAPYQLNFSVLGHSQNNSISYQPLCDALDMLKPIFIGSGALSSMFILMGYSRPSGTGAN